MVTHMIMAFVCALAAREGKGGAPAAAAPRGPAPLVAVLALRFDGEHANVLEPGDTAVARAATAKLLATLAASPAVTVADPGRVAAAVAAAEAGGNRCDARCAVEIGRQVGAQWVVAGTLLKTSNLVWVLLGELLDVASGRTVLADSYELKGDATRMAPAGAHVFAQRVERAVTAAGVTPAGRAAP
jgi:TolB-like protein